MITRGMNFCPINSGVPLRLATPSEEAVVDLGLDAPGPRLFGQAMGRGEEEGISLVEELDRSRGFAAISATA